MSVNTITLRCPKCERQKEVARLSYDYPEAVRMEVACPKCNAGDFCEPQYFDENGAHITRDPKEV